MNQKQVKIIGLSVNKNFGGLKATELKFDKDNRLTLIKGEVGSGKTTMSKALKLTTQGSSTLTDKRLYGDVDLCTQLSDGDNCIFVGCRTSKEGGLDYFLYSVDENGKKIKDVVVDGQRLTPAGYLQSLQTALTWRLDELTSESPSVQRNILLELYRKELEEVGVVFDKSHPKFTDGIIHQIEVAKNNRSLMDMKRKEVGGIADDLNKKGINYSLRKKLKPEEDYLKKVSKIEAKITLLKTNVEETKKNKLNEIKLDATSTLSKIKDINNDNVKTNSSLKNLTKKTEQVYEIIDELIKEPNRNKLVKETIQKNLPKNTEPLPEVAFDDKGKIISKAKEFKSQDRLFQLVTKHKELQKKYKKLKKSEEDVDSSELDEKLTLAKKELDDVRKFNKEAESVNALHDWQDANDEVIKIKKDYYMKLTEINTGVKGLHICIDENSEDDNNIYLMYNGSYDKNYFNNPNKELRKLSSYSGTQKPMICLLIQNYLLSKKQKALRYLWIDDVPIDNKTRGLLDKMANELDLWLFVNWTGDFKASKLKDGEILIENGEILMK